MPYKSKLSIWCQRNRVDFPSYNTAQHTGPAHAPIFPSVSCKIFGNTYIITGDFKSKKEAEETVARSILKKIKKNGSKPLVCKDKDNYVEINIDDKGNDKKEKKVREKRVRVKKEVPVENRENEGTTPENNEETQTLKTSPKNPQKIYLIDFDNSAGIKDRLNTIEGEIHLFISFVFNEKSIPSFNGTVHKAFSPTPEMVDHMMTWFSCKNIESFKGREVIIVSRDVGLNALRELLHNEGIKVEFKSDI